MLCQRNSKPLDIDTRIDLLRRQVEELMEYHNELVKQGKIPAYRLMGLHNNYSANHPRRG